MSIIALFLIPSLPKNRGLRLIAEAKSSKILHLNRKEADMVQFLVHDKADTVGVATVDIKAGELAEGKTMDTQEAVKIKALSDIPLGHKIALKDCKVGDTIIKYSNDIGKVVADIKAGDHVHIHNLKTKRW